MDADLLQELNKKDDDIEIVSTANGEIIINTTLAEEELDGFSEVETQGFGEDRYMIIDELNGPLMDIRIRVIRVMFMINAMLSCFILTGFIPYQFLLYDETRTVAYWVLGIWLTMCASLYVAMAFGRRMKIASVLLVFWCFSYYAVLIDIAALLRDLAPLQFGMVTFAQSLSIIVYTVWSPSNIDPWKSFYVMLATGLLGWAIGIYAFILQQDWIPAILLLLADGLSAAYSALQIHYSDRYSISYEDSVESIIRFYSDPLIWGVKWVKNLYNRRAVQNAGETVVHQ